MLDEKRPLVDRFVRAFRDGSEAELTSVLAADVGFWSDGGGKVLAARRPVFGREQVVNLLIGIRRTAPAAGVAARVGRRSRSPRSTASRRCCMRVGGRLDGVYMMTIEDDAIAAIRVVRNPDKLTYIERQLATH